jgi:flagellar hook assembly protein FlgD
MHRVRIAVYDVSGAVVRVLADGMIESGRHTVSWDGRNAHGEAVASGVYFVRISAGSSWSSRKMVLVR